MRPLVLVVLLAVAGGVFAATGSARSSAPGDGCLVVTQGFGKVTVSLTRGVVFGRYSEGYLVYNDQGDIAHLPTVSGVTPTHPTDHTWKYSNATDVRFRASGPTKLVINAQFINLSVAGKGTTTLSSGGFDPTVVGGKFSVDSNSFCEDNFQRMPVLPTKFQIASPLSG